MQLLRGLRPRRARPGRRTAHPGGADPAHLASFASSRAGVEAYLEPPTNVTPATLLLVAADGEWTRRRVGGARDAATLTRRLGVPLYDVNLTGYPARVREWSARQRRAGSPRVEPA